MAMGQQKFREVVFQLLYCFDVGQNQGRNVGSLLQNLTSVSKKMVDMAMQKTEVIVLHLKEIDQKIAAVSTNYSFDRIQVIDRNILRLGVYELTIEGEVPPKVAIAEALRLAQKFSTSESVTYINAVMDGVYKEMLGDQNRGVDTSQ